MLRMQAALLLDKYQHGAHSCNGSQYNDAGKKSEDDIEDEETDYTTTYSTGGPIDVPTLKAHEHQRTLQSLEDRVLRTAFLIRVLHGLRSDTEEQRKSLGSSDEEDTGTDDHHDLLLDILLLVVHGDVHRDSTHNGYDTGDRIAELDNDRYVLGDLLRDGGKGSCTCRIVTSGVLGHHEAAAEQHDGYSHHELLVKHCLGHIAAKATEHAAYVHALLALNERDFHVFRFSVKVEQKSCKHNTLVATEL